MSGVRHLQDHGSAAVVITETEIEDGEDEYGDPSTTETETETSVVVDRSPKATQGVGGHDVKTDAVIYIDGSLTVRDGSDGVPSRVRVDGHEYEVQVVYPSGELLKAAGRRV